MAGGRGRRLFRAARSLRLRKVICASEFLLLERTPTLILTFSTPSNFESGSYQGARFKRLLVWRSGGRGVWPCTKPSSCTYSRMGGSWRCYKSKRHARVLIEPHRDAALLGRRAGKERRPCALQGRCASGRQPQSREYLPSVNTRSAARLFKTMWCAGFQGC